MKSDVAHGIVQDGPQAHRPKANEKMLNEPALFSEKAPRRIQLEKPILERLVAEVKETIATDVELSKANKPAAFSVVDLWNIRKGRRTAAGFRKYPINITGLSY